VPEGDTIWRSAARLHAALAGRPVTRFASPLPEIAAGARRYRVVGAPVSGVEARGKHLLVRFPRAALHTHMGMTGSWHLYRPGSRWRQAPEHARVVVETAEAVAVCFTPRTLEWVSELGQKEHPALAALGPDVMSPGFDAAESRQRLLARPEMEIGAALLDQTALAGIGNIYKSETLFLCGVHPFTRVADLDPAKLESLAVTASRLMRRTMATGDTRTRARYWVYRRMSQPCRKCGTTICMRRQGEQARSSYWCPRCQAPPLRGGYGP
jgi:endonuclease-8